MFESEYGTLTRDDLIDTAEKGPLGSAQLVRTRRNPIRKRTRSRNDKGTRSGSNVGVSSNDHKGRPPEERDSVSVYSSGSATKRRFVWLISRLGCTRGSMGSSRVESTTAEYGNRASSLISDRQTWGRADVHFVCRLPRSTNRAKKPIKLRRRDRRKKCV